jgi:signal transduction histidine kinase
VPEQLPAIPLSSQVRHHLFLSCKEALNNVVKHANADEVMVSIRVESHSLIIVIRDDGCGHAGAHANGNDGTGGRRLTGGAGLENMRRRMEGVDGKCEVRSVDGEGASVTFTVPVLPGPAET